MELFRKKQKSPNRQSNASGGSDDTISAMFGGFRPEPIPNVEIAELEQEIVSGRTEEWANIIRLGNQSSYLTSQLLCLAVVIDQPGDRLANWRRFAQEREMPFSYMWGNGLQQQPTSSAPVVPGLSYTARLILASLRPIKNLYRRTPRDLAERLCLKESHCNAAIGELLEARYAERHNPTLREGLNELTVSELTHLTEGLDIRKSWEKSRKIEVIMEEVPEGAINDLVRKHNPSALDPCLMIGLKPSENFLFHWDWAELTGHYLVMSAYRAREWKEYRNLIESGVNARDIRVTSMKAPDDCERCGSDGRTLPANNSQSWPPFHLGCRCSVEVDF